MKKLLAIFTMVVLCGVIPVADSFALDCSSGYTFVVGSPTTNANDYQHKLHTGTGSNADGDLEPGEWKDTWTSGDILGTIKGVASCNSTAGNNNSMNWNTDSSNWLREVGEFDNSANTSVTTNRYCWCMPTEWIPSGSESINLSAAWVFRLDNTSSSNCARNCAAGCADYVYRIVAFRSAVFGTIENSPIGKCVANNISINWKNSSGGTQSSTSCTYDGALITPTAAPEKRGYTFTGWVAQ